MEKIIFLIFILFSCSSSDLLSNTQNMKLKITVGNKIFTATLIDKDISRELIKYLPMEITMNDHNGNEKFYNLPENILGRVSNPGRVETGDIMIWSSNTIVLFYASSSTSYNYIRVGKIDDPSGLSDVVGRGNIKVKFELF